MDNVQISILFTHVVDAPLLHNLPMVTDTPDLNLKFTVFISQLTRQ